ncbi:MULTISPECIES: hypothetical protein [Pasteurellaceae]|uniref:Uncharacterized protein n=1 Tax=Glaesserella australis TaxID=2094024 RepID=A0A328BXN5_9PAST|nr:MULTISPECIES: hypothetical protein [Pasteurellaceae]AUI65179.1 hypothetical protein CJD39_00690 [Glaesserella sp. 15-184]RAL18451.1 hypothetical protein C5N92_06980 [Glaesserella australis]UKH19840.1 hypothetical protein D1109_01145 [Actinobacillus pleuropneumoniae]UKH21686.1 hypothetical protein D1109_11350 [Actinobacillus pleuropneumoniae]UPA21425.1 hypothetical protein JS559_02870 [Actinobacillus pleuropneumoniae]
MTCFKHWTNRVTDGTGDLFWLGRLLISKNERDNTFSISVFDSDGEFLMDESFKTRADWKRVYRSARNIIKDECIDCRSFVN